MRVIAGTYRSRRLHTLRGAALRPTSDRLRETLFDVLADEVKDTVFVDAFAGSGAVGIEALSRGARHAIFIENHRAAVALLRRNLESLGIGLGTQLAASRRPQPVPSLSGVFPGTAEIVALDADEALERLVALRLHLDVVFADPPYADEAAYHAVLEILGASLLAKNGLVILEHNRRRELPPNAGALERFRVLEQGDAALSFYRRLLAA
jgi:16S rRNA (guanine(966)-N(2))-methyltransferase RsmD